MANSRSDALLLFGVTGDLAHKIIFPAIYAMAKRGALSTPIIGVAFSEVEFGTSAQARDGQHRTHRRNRQQARAQTLAVSPYLCKWRL